MNLKNTRYYIVSNDQISYDYILDKLANDYRIPILLIMEIINTPATKFNQISSQYDLPTSDIIEIINCFIGLQNNEN